MAAAVAGEVAQAEVAGRVPEIALIVVESAFVGTTASDFIKRCVDLLHAPRRVRVAVAVGMVYAWRALL